jgi:hypothetical protein
VADGTHQMRMLFPGFEVPIAKKLKVVNIALREIRIPRTNEKKCNHLQTLNQFNKALISCNSLLKLSKLIHLNSMKKM